MVVVNADVVFLPVDVEIGPFVTYSAADVFDQRRELQCKRRAKVNQSEPLQQQDQFLSRIRVVNAVGVHAPEPGPVGKSILRAGLLKHLNFLGNGSESRQQISS